MTFILKSRIRLEIINLLYNSPLKIRDIQEISMFSYSSITSHLKKLKGYGFVEKNGPEFGLSEDFKAKFEKFLNLNSSLNFINENKNFLNAHKIFNMDSSALGDLSPLCDMELIVNDNDDIFKVRCLINDFLRESKSVKSIFPYFPQKSGEIFDSWIDNEADVKLILSNSVFKSFKDFICEYDFDREMGDFSLDVKTADQFMDVLLVISDKGVLLGFYKNDGDFNGNAVFFSRNRRALEWAENVFAMYGDSCGDYIGLDEFLMKSNEMEGD